MQFEKEIERAVRYNAAFDTDAERTKEDIQEKVKQVTKILKAETYDFSLLKSIILRQNKKKRVVKHYEGIYSAENILCQCIKQILDRIFKVKYPNRNIAMKELFGLLPALQTMCNFTIVKFDFKDYFNSISATYVFEKYLKPKIQDRFEMDLIEKFVNQTKYTYAGLSTSNVIAEIAAKHFDDILLQTLTTKGVVFFERYIDDSVLVLNENIDEEEIKQILGKVLKEVFHDKNINSKKECKTNFNNPKCKIVSKSLLSMNTQQISFDYLGYEFFFSNDKQEKTKIQYGITKEKREKYSKQVCKFIKCYLDSNKDSANLELLRQRILAFSSRVVYRNKKIKSNVWKVKGFISNYGELRYLLSSGIRKKELIHEDTKKFLKEMILDEFSKKKCSEPYFLKDKSKSSGYNLFNNMINNRTILLVEHIGYDYKSLVKLCSKINIKTSSNGKKCGYGNLVRNYLIKIKVGY